MRRRLIPMLKLTHCHFSSPWFSASSPSQSSHSISLRRRQRFKS